MPKPLERKIENDCVLIAAASGVPADKLEKAKRSKPDRIFYLPGGQPLIVEFKRPGEKPRPQQDERLSELRDLGYIVAVIDSVSDFRELFAKLMA